MDTRDKLDAYISPRGFQRRLKALEINSKKLSNYFNTSDTRNINGDGQQGNQQGKTNSPGVDSTDVVATYAPDFTQDGILRLKLTIVVTGDSRSIRGFSGYAYRVYGFHGDVQEYKNYVNPETLGLTDFTTFTAPVSKDGISQTINVSVKAMNSLFGDSAWSLPIPVVVAQDTTAPVTPSAPTLTSKVGTIIVTFPTGTDSDWDYTEVWVGSGSGFTTGTGSKVGQSRVGIFLFQWDNVVDVASGWDYVKLRSVDKSGNVSALSAGTNITSGIKTSTLQVNGTISDGAVTGNKIANNAVGNAQMGVITDITRIVPDLQTNSFNFTDSSGNIRGRLFFQLSSNSIQLETFLTPLSTDLTLNSLAAINITSTNNLTMSATGSSVVISGALTIISPGSVLIGSDLAATTDTDGFAYIASVAGTPTGAATTHTNYNALLWDRTNHKLFVYDASWRLINSGGTVTSVAITAPAEISVSGSPVTTSGTLALSWANAGLNKVFAGPSSVGAGTPAFRSLVPADIPDLSATYIATSLLTTKGDLLVSKGGGVLGRLGIGADGTIHTADSAAATGSKWSTSLSLSGGGAFGSDLTVDASGGNTTTPRVIGLINLGTARFQFGDEWNSIQTSNGDRLQFQSYHGMEIWGARATTGTHLAFVTGGGSSDASLLIGGSQAGTVVAIVKGASGQTHDIFEIQNSGGTPLSSIDASGNYKVSGLQIIGARQTGYGNASGTVTKAAWNTGLISTVSALSQIVGGLWQAMFAHGLIGT